MATTAQMEALRALRDLQRKNPAPSLLEWAEAAGLAYTTINYHRRKLYEAGYLTSVPGRVRSMQITETGKRALRRAAASR